MTLLRLRRAALLAGLAVALVLGGCAHPPASVPAAPGWTGRLALQIDADQAQSFSAGFELGGNARSGRLSLFTPLGGTLAVLAWSPGSATLQANNEVRSFESLDALVARATGTAIPVAALFDWLAGTPSPVPGWQPDLSQLAHGRLAARRIEPTPAADLRLVLDR